MLCWLVTLAYAVTLQNILGRCFETMPTKKSVTTRTEEMPNLTPDEHTECSFRYQSCVSGRRSYKHARAHAHTHSHKHDLPIMIRGPEYLKQGNKSAMSLAFVVFAE